MNARVYAGLFPNEVAGLVLIDSAHEDEPLRAPKFYLAHTAPRLLWHPLDLVVRTASFVGLIRFAQGSPMHGKNAAQMSSEELMAGLRKQPKSVVNNITSGVVLPESYDEARAVGTCGDIPLIVLTAGTPYDFGDPDLNRQAAAYQQVWVHEIQPKLARLSTRGRQIVVPNASHGTIPQELIISAIREVVTEIRGEGASD